MSLPDPPGDNVFSATSASSSQSDSAIGSLQTTYHSAETPRFNRRSTQWQPLYRTETSENEHSVMSQYSMTTETNDTDPLPNLVQSLIVTHR